MTLGVEVYNAMAKDWVQLPELKPGDRPGSVSQNKPDGEREVYLFECAPDNSHSTIYRSTFGADTEIAETRVITTAGLEIVKELKRGEEPYVLTLKTDISDARRIIRFTHK
ncbi:hypothetical protein A3J19_01080 [Candidatus Daviesbacteria bacterium RIFCSPLOWO2_02_FULL_41_8]|uniref:Uncharacterized protein n=2 Tax=Patescibacteria group TaxID=1783273 RepID=A0A1F5NKJ3_9BACT|nr:MAG: hypothetical protein A3J19_01080 [Candidatus Daviesbacteria bacterium RIFCSPLOWO2_02_FULL_41_8]OGZ37649.1 MAG: hypothetical protein A3E90_00420 [Candidatus Portnoybacteria bacterium RIFCSPHIGHO2_12_FULL_40_11]